MNNIWLFTSLLGYPLYYYYIRLQSCDTHIDWRWIWLVFPALFVSVFSFVLYFAMSPEETDLFIYGMLYHEKALPEVLPPLVRWQQWCHDVLFRIVFLTELILSVFFSLRSISRYNREIYDFYSDTQGKDLSPMKWITAAFLFASFISVLSAAIGKDFFVNKGMLLAFPSITHSSFLFFLGWVGYRQNFTISDLRKEQESYEEEEAFSDRKYVQVLTIEELEDVILERKLFRKTDLRIIDLADILQTNRTYISRLVNESRGESFCEWINNFRVDYAGKIFEDVSQEDRTVLSVSEESGFSSSSSFYRAFKERKKLSPKQYREYCLSQKEKICV